MEESFTTQKILKPSELKSLNKKSDFMGLFQLGSHAGAIIFLGYKVTGLDLSENSMDLY